tara:strand:- start:3135 stop:3605 length:471 start_codon:yes stop_codon:yes gene_type:complete
MYIKDSILILHASQTGTSEELTKDAERQLVDEGYIVRNLDCSGTNPELLREHSTCLLITSTWGEGELPKDAEVFYYGLEQNYNLDLTHLRFAVFGLGDSKYAQFNECGKNFDKMLKDRGGSRLLPRVDCDININGPFENWINQIKRTLMSATSHIC